MEQKSLGTITVPLEDYAMDLVMAYISGIETVKALVKDIPCDKEAMLENFRSRLLEKRENQESACGSI